MEGILRIVHNDQITDHDLSSLGTPIRQDDFVATPDGNNWSYICGTQSGVLTPGLAIVIDRALQTAALVLESLPEDPRLIPWQQGLTLGRRVDNHVALADGFVSGHHCRVEKMGDGWHLLDLNSTNGTFVNDRRVANVLLRNGDVIKLGRYRFRVADGLILENSDQRVQFSVAVQRPVLAATMAPYPWYARSPRVLCPPAPLSVTIEDAPSIGNKPTMGLGGLSINPATMAMNLGNQVLRYGLGKRRYNKQEKQLADLYAAYLGKIEQQLRDHAEAQRAYAQGLHPDIPNCLRRADVAAPDLWERQVGDPDFLTLRVGSGTVPAEAEVRIPPQHLQLQQSELDKMPKELADRYANVADMPICCDLMKHGSCGVIGPRSATDGLLREMVIQLAALHSYEDVKLVVLTTPADAEHWSWMRWLPHCQSTDGKHRFILTGRNDQGAAEALEHLAQQRLQSQADPLSTDFSSAPCHYVVIVPQAGASMGPKLRQALFLNQPELGISGIFAGDLPSQVPHSIRNLIHLHGPRPQLQTAQGVLPFEPSQSALTPEQLSRFSRAMAPIRLRTDGQTSLPTAVPFLESQGIAALEELDLGARWARSDCSRTMAVPIGVTADGQHFHFDIHEKAHGPHGLVAGMTGSGKSEMVMSWILSMALHFSPQDVSFVLVDFKGTGLIKPFERLPHLAGTISDLDVNISRNLVALNSELERRKALFDAAGVNKIADYLRLYRTGAVKEPLPYLFVIIDEYAEFKTQFPDFTNRVNSLFRVGRSLGVHIVLMTQNPAGVVTGESESNVRFRWCLKVASPSASREMLGTHSDAAYLTDPGRAYVQVGSDEVFETVQSFYSGAPYIPGDHSAVTEEIFRISLSGEAEKIRLPRSNTGAVAQIDAIVSYIADYTARMGIAPARRIWQDRMRSTLYLEDLPANGNGNGTLEPVVGMVDDPAGQTQLPLTLPLSAQGHVALFGCPGSGKTLFLQTAALSLCRTYSPDEVELYAMDFGSWSLGAFKDFPHMRMVANGSEEETLKQMSEILTRELQQRRQRFADAGAGNLRAFRKLSDEPMPYIVVLVDRFEVARTATGLEELFLQISREGGNYGIYLVLTAGNTSGLGFKLEQNFKTKLALQLNTPSDYLSVVGRTGGLLPESFPGRGLVNLGGVKEFQLACPIKPWDDETGTLAIRREGEELLDRWGAPQTRSLQVMPATIPFGSVQSKNEGYILGIEHDTLEAVTLCLDRPHHLLISGIAGSGKTTLLKTLARQMAAQDFPVTVFGGDDWDLPGITLLRTGADADAYIESLRNTLSQRQAQKKEDPHCKLTPVCFLIDGYRRFFDEISQQSADRLKAFAMVGSTLGLQLAVADQAHSLAALAQFREPVVAILAAGPAVALGGKAMDHQALNLDLPTAQKSLASKPAEGWFRNGEKLCRFKAMDHK